MTQPTVPAQGSCPSTKAAGPTMAPPTPAEIKYTGQYSVNPMDGVSFRTLCARIPSVVKRITGMSWAVDRAAVALLLVCQVTVGLTAVGQLTAASKVMRSILGDGTVQERLHQALPALVFVAVMAALSRAASAVSAYGDRRIGTDVDLPDGRPCLPPPTTLPLPARLRGRGQRLCHRPASGPAGKPWPDAA
ncbi:hypothetical protein [Streptomyces sp. NPDC096013]|uniref:hypothetical protein n=1 Tax=Streptomyces sp. NPDC096013 TaxID=3366069 RepID=UPI0037FA8D9C